uniref:Uncharacterized protein n=1 Tax=Arundo donax TaxID=35708 RepID=A0A0A9A5Y1_ARUDO
MTKDEAPQI